MKVWTRIGIALGAVLLVSVCALLGMWSWLQRDQYPSRLVDFHPSPVSEHTPEPFFYSVDNELKYGRSISESAPTLVTGKILSVTVSPDRKQALVIANQTLYLIDGPAAVTTKIVPVASLHPKRKPIGTAFFRDTGFQWS